MSHHIYTTESFVLESTHSGESGKFIKFFTKDLGLVFAQAQGVKEVKSKLRFGLEDYSFSLVSFVRGKSGWRVTGALPIKNLYSLFREDKDKINVCAETLNLIKRLVAGEEKNQELFDLLYSAFDFLEKEKLNPQELSNFECLLVLRIVGNLGYLAHSRKTSNFIEDSSWSPQTLAEMSSVKREAVKLINQSFIESGLY